MSRVPFGYSLVDKRHKGFVDGQRDVLLSLAHVMLSKGFILTLILGGVGLFGFLRLGIGGLAYGFSVRNEWVTTDATIVSIVPVQRGDRFNWYYFYSFQTEDGEQVSGKTVEGRRDVFIPEYRGCSEENTYPGTLHKRRSAACCPVISGNRY